MEMLEVSPEVENTRERIVYGRLNLAEVPVQSLICLPQVRKGENTEFGELKESIKAQDLLQPISIAKLNKEQFGLLIDHINSIWHTKVEVDDYVSQNVDGVYNTVIAGNSRTKALQQIANESDDVDAFVWVNVHDISDPNSFLGVQISENIHSQPSRERRAMAIVGNYERGLRAGEWKNAAEFRRKSGSNFSPRVIKEALSFASLPVEVRKAIFEGKLPYSVGVEIGEGTETVMQYALKKLQEDTTVQEITPELFDKVYRLNIERIVSHIQEQRLNITKARAYAKAEIGQMDRYINPDGYIPQALFSLEQIQESYLERLERDYQNAIKRMASHSIASVVRAVELAEELRNGAGRASHEEEYNKREEVFRELLGRIAVENVEKVAA